MSSNNYEQSEFYQMMLEAKKEVRRIEEAAEARRIEEEAAEARRAEEEYLLEHSRRCGDDCIYKEWLLTNVSDENFDEWLEKKRFERRTGKYMSDEYLNNLNSLKNYLLPLYIVK